MEEGVAKKDCNYSSMELMIWNKHLFNSMGAVWEVVDSTHPYGWHEG